MATRKAAAAEVAILQLKITLEHIERPIWRRVLVPSGTTLARLHVILNEAMGWERSHPHVFEIGDRAFADPREGTDGDPTFEDERRAVLGTLVQAGDRFRYDYDFSDGWRHDVRVEKRLPVDPRFAYPLCIAGARACPPDGCGGPPGYRRLLRARSRKRDPGHDEAVSELGGCFDPEGFDVNRTNRALRALNP